MAKDELLEEEETSDKKKKKKDKKDKKGEKFDAVVSDSGTALYTDADEEEESGGILSVLVVIFIIIIWLAILALLVKLDVGGFGSSVLRPVLKDVPVINKILPDNIDEELEEELEFSNLDDALAEIVGESRNQLQRFIRLTYLIEPLQEMVDGRHESEIKIAFNPAVELSFLTTDEQYDLADAIVANDRTPSLAQCQEFKRLSHDGELTTEFIQETLETEKPNQKEKLSFKMSEIDQYFPKDFTPNRKKDLIIHLLENWARKKSREQER